LAKTRPGLCTLGHRSIRFAQYAGLINLGERVLEVLPKVDEDNGEPEVGRGMLLRLLRLAGNLKLPTYSSVTHDLRRQSLLEVFINAFFDSVSSLVRAGLLRRYRTLEDDIPLVKGRLLIARQATVHAMRMDKLACNFDELTADNVWNQGLKAALIAVKPWIRTIDVARRWQELTAAFDEVSLVAMGPDALDALLVDRQAQRYVPSMQWAKWILRLLSPNLRAGSNEAPGLLFDMNQLFETAIVTLLRQRARGRPALQIVAQETGSHLATTIAPVARDVFRLRPDILLREAGKVIAIGDTKWTRVNSNTYGEPVPSESHMYQMLAYANAFSCSDFSLIYPWHGGMTSKKPTSFLLKQLGDRFPKVHVTCVDVSTDLFRSTSGSDDSPIEDMLGSRDGLHAPD